MLAKVLHTIQHTWFNWLKVNRYEVEFNTFFKVEKPSIHLKYCPVPTQTFVWHTFVTTFVSVVCGSFWSNEVENRKLEPTSGHPSGSMDYGHKDETGLVPFVLREQLSEHVLEKDRSWLHFWKTWLCSPFWSQRLSQKITLSYSHSACDNIKS